MPQAHELLFTFTTAALPPEKFGLVKVTGQESISELFQFDLDLVSADADVDSSQIVNRPARIEIDRDGNVAVLHGIVSRFEQRDQGPEFVNYHAVLVPRLYALELTRQCRVFLDKNVKSIIDEVLQEDGLSSGTDYELKLTQTYAVREYVVQYQESDLNFIRRLMEHEGIFFFFEHGDKQEKLVIADSMDAHQPVSGESSIPFRDARAVSAGGEAVGALTFRQQVMPRKVILKDYNYRKPSLEIKGTADAVGSGVGTVMEYGDHFKDPDEGKRLAGVRAEELICREKIYFGESGCQAFSAGATFTLQDHFRSSHNMKYLLVEVRHFGEQLGIVGSASGGEASRPSYTNQFQAIPADVQFRPLRITPKPRIQGVMHASVDGAGGSDYAEIDDTGRYKVKLPFDLSSAGGGKASQFIRMAQPYSGADYGMHFPLHKGTEVLLTHLDGDPDRPIISGSVPNPDTGSPVTAANHTQCVIRTGSDNKIVIEDTRGNERIKMSTPHSTTSVYLGSPNPNGQPGYCMKTTAFSNNNIGQDSTTKIGINRETKIGSNSKVNIGANSDMTITANLTNSIGGSLTETVVGKWVQSVGGNALRSIQGMFKDFMAGNFIKFTGGAQSDFIVGAKTEVVLGMKLDQVTGVKIDLSAAKIVDKSPEISNFAARNVCKAGAYACKVAGQAMLKAGGSMGLKALKINQQADDLKIDIAAGVATTSAKYDLATNTMRVKAASFALSKGLDLKAKGDKLSVKANTFVVK